MRLLCTLGIGAILARLAIFFAIKFLDFLLAGIDAERREVDRVSTHISNASVLIQVLRNHHRLADGESQFAGSLLLEC